MKKKYTCIILDDDNFARETLADYLSMYNNIVLIKSLGDSKLAIRDFAILKPDIIFLDINMPNKTGLEIQQEILALNLNSKIIFITAHDKYVLDAFKNNAYDYLIKPVKISEFQATLDRLINELDYNQTSIITKDSTSNDYNDQEQKEIIIRNSYETLIFNCNDIIYVKADKGYTDISLINDSTKTISKNIGKIEHLFLSDYFFKISRSSIINIKYLSKINRLKHEVILSASGKNICLKASKNKLYDLEIIVSKLNIKNNT